MIPQYSAEITTLQHLCINSVFVQDIARVTVVRHVENKKYWSKRYWSRMIREQFLLEKQQT